MKPKSLFALLLALSVCLPIRAELTAEKKKEIEKMLQLTGMVQITNQVMTQMIDGLRAQNSSLPAEFWDRLAQRMDSSELVEKIIPLYDKYYSLEDLKAVNEFYSSPVGQRVLRTLPEIMRESMQIGQAWGEKIGAQAAAEVMAELKAKEKSQEASEPVPVTTP